MKKFIPENTPLGDHSGPLSNILRVNKRTNICSADPYTMTKNMEKNSENFIHNILQSKAEAQSVVFP